MKKKIFLGIGIVLLALIGYLGYIFLTTKSHSPFAEESVNHNGLEITVAYCQPFKKGRLIFGEDSEDALLPYGKYWRLGANEATEISFSSEVDFAGATVPAGRYRMYAVPGKDSWEVSLNSELDKWGAMEPDYSLDVAKVKVPSEISDSEVEQLTIGFSEDSSGAIMTIAWDKTKVSVPIR